MKRKLTFLPMMVALLMTAACSIDGLSRNVYEGIQNRNQSLKTPQEKAMDPPPQSYRDYERERLGKSPATQ